MHSTLTSLRHHASTKSPNQLRARALQLAQDLVQATPRVRALADKTCELDRVEAEAGAQIRRGLRSKAFAVCATDAQAWAIHDAKELDHEAEEQLWEALLRDPAAVGTMYRMIAERAQTDVLDPAESKTRSLDWHELFIGLVRDLYSSRTDVTLERLAHAGLSLLAKQEIELHVTSGGNLNNLVPHTFQGIITRRYCTYLANSMDEIDEWLHTWAADLANVNAFETDLVRIFITRAAASQSGGGTTISRAANINLTNTNPDDLYANPQIKREFDRRLVAVRECATQLLKAYMGVLEERDEYIMALAKVYFDAISGEFVFQNIPHNDRVLHVLGVIIRAILHPLVVRRAAGASNNFGPSLKLIFAFIDKVFVLDGAMATTTTVGTTTTTTKPWLATMATAQQPMRHHALSKSSMFPTPLSSSSSTYSHADDKRAAADTSTTNSLEVLVLGPEHDVSLLYDLTASVFSPPRTIWVTRRSSEFLRFFMKEFQTTPLVQTLHMVVARIPPADPHFTTFVGDFDDSEGLTFRLKGLHAVRDAILKNENSLPTSFRGSASRGILKYATSGSADGLHIMDDDDVDEVLMTMMRPTTNTNAKSKSTNIQGDTFSPVPQLLSSQPATLTAQRMLEWKDFASEKRREFRDAISECPNLRVAELFEPDATQPATTANNNTLVLHRLVAQLEAYVQATPPTAETRKRNESALEFCKTLESDSSLGLILVELKQDLQQRMYATQRLDMESEALIRFLKQLDEAEVLVRKREVALTEYMSVLERGNGGSMDRTKVMDISYRSGIYLTNPVLVFGSNAVANDGSFKKNIRGSARSFRGRMFGSCCG